MASDEKNAGNHTDDAGLADNMNQLGLGDREDGPPKTEEEYAQSQLTLRAIVSSKEAGVIIGKQGKNVADLRDETGVKAGVSKVVQGVHDRVLTVTGPLSGISKAYSLVAKGLLEGAPQMGMGGVVQNAGTHRKQPRFSSIIQYSNPCQPSVSSSPTTKWARLSADKDSKSNISKTYPVSGWLRRRRCFHNPPSALLRSKVLPKVLTRPSGRLENASSMIGSVVPALFSTILLSVFKLPPVVPLLLPSVAVAISVVALETIANTIELAVAQTLRIPEATTALRIVSLVEEVFPW